MNPRKIALLAEADPRLFYGKEKRADLPIDDDRRGELASKSIKHL
jgi:hypothetical protein